MKKIIQSLTALVGDKRHLRNDLILVGGLLVLLIVCGLAFFLIRPDGDVVTVEVDGKHYGTYELSKDRVVDIVTGEHGGELNRLVIKNGEAYVETATCPDGICSNHRPVSRDGESIVCLPHKVVITVHQAGGEEPDIVA